MVSAMGSSLAWAALPVLDAPRPPDRASGGAPGFLAPRAWLRRKAAASRAPAGYVRLRSPALDCCRGFPDSQPRSAERRRNWSFRSDFVQCQHYYEVRRAPGCVLLMVSPLDLPLLGRHGDGFEGDIDGARPSGAVLDPEGHAALAFNQGVECRGLTAMEEILFAIVASNKAESSLENESFDNALHVARAPCSQLFGCRFVVNVDQNLLPPWSSGVDPRNPAKRVAVEMLHPAAVRTDPRQAVLVVRLRSARNIAKALDHLHADTGLE